MKTHFAAPQRSDDKALHRQIECITHSPVVNGLMQMVGGLIAVLNQNRQILTVNHRLLELMGLDHPDQILGLRPGEALECRDAAETDAGCGTGPHCMTCGAAIAIVSALVADGPVERDCALAVERSDGSHDLFFHVMAHPVEIEQKRFVLLFMHDRTQQQQQASLERAFFHDINNTISGLLNAAEILVLTGPNNNEDMARHIVGLSRRLDREVELQRHLSVTGSTDIAARRELLSVDAIMKELQKSLQYHPSGQGRQVMAHNGAPGMQILTDSALLTRALSNMLINACESSDTGSPVAFDAEANCNEIIFSVWNNQYITHPVRRRIFQRNFSTKEGFGRGLGTYSLKLIAEKLLQGRVYFESSTDVGTRFYLCIPADNTRFQ